MLSHPEKAGASPERLSYLAALRRSQRLRQILLGVLYLSALSILIVWEYRERLEVNLSSECDLRDQEKPGLYSSVYSRLLNWTASDAAGHVVSVAIPDDQKEIQNNLASAVATWPMFCRLWQHRTPPLL